MGRYYDKLHSSFYNLNKPRGFTLVELLIVIGVLGVLATVLLIVIDPRKQLQKARDTKRKANIAQIQQALELYRSDLGEYPGTLPGCRGNLTQGSVDYLKGMPCDPVGTDVVYIYTPSVTTPILTYTLKACLENISDTEKDNPQQTGCASGRYTYTRSNP